MSLYISHHVIMLPHDSACVGSVHDCLHRITLGQWLYWLVTLEREKNKKQKLCEHLTLYPKACADLQDAHLHTHVPIHRQSKCLPTYLALVRGWSSILQWVEILWVTELSHLIAPVSSECGWTHHQ